MKSLRAVISLILTMTLLLSALPVGAAGSFGTLDYDPVGDDISATVSPYLEEGGFESEDNFLTIDDFASHYITFINIWSNGCGPCIAEMPYFQQIHEEFGNQGVLVVGGCTTWISGNFAAEYEYLQNHGYTYINVIPDDTLRNLYYHNSYVPQTFIVNSEGVVVDFIGGGTNYATLVLKIQYWLSIYADDQVEYEDHTITFVDGLTNDVLNVQVVPHFGQPAYPVPPAHEGYNFVGWDPATVIAVINDMTITATYSVKTFTVRFMDGMTDALIVSRTVPYGSAAIAPEPINYLGYDFIGWSADFTYVTSNMTVYSVYQPSVEPTPEPTAAPPAILSGVCGAQGDNLTWTLDIDTGVLTISGTGEMKDYTWNSMPWFSYRSKLKSVIVNEGATSIGECAFESFGVLKTVSLPSSLVSIGREAFEFCYKLQEINFPDALTSIGYCAFAECNKLEYVFIPENVTLIDFGAFIYCSSLKVALFYGAPPVVEEAYTDIFESTHEGFIIYYTSAYASAWAPHGESLWKSYHIALRPVRSVVFIDPIDNTMIANRQVPWGEAAEAPAPPQHDGYEFVGWDKAFDFVTADTVVYAVYEKLHVAGDIDGDGSLTFVDVTAFSMFLSGRYELSAEQLEFMDLNGDGEVSYADISAMYSLIIS